MRVRPGVVLAASSVTIIAAVGVTAVHLAPSESRLWLSFCVAFGVATSFQSVTSEPRDLTPALLFSLAPVIALVAEGSPTWLVGPLGALLLLAGELNALSWDWPGDRPVGILESRRLWRSAGLVSLGAAASLVVLPIGRSAALGGTAAVALAAVALAALGAQLFRRRG